MRRPDGCNFARIIQLSAYQARRERGGTLMEENHDGAENAKNFSATCEPRIRQRKEQTFL